MGIGVLRAGSGSSKLEAVAQTFVINIMATAVPSKIPKWPTHVAVARRMGFFLEGPG